MGGWEGKGLGLLGAGLGELPPGALRGEVCKSSSSWGRCPTLLCRACWRLHQSLCAQDRVSSRDFHRALGECYGSPGPACSGAKVGMNSAFRVEREPSLLTTWAVHAHVQVPKLQSGVWLLQVLTPDSPPPRRAHHPLPSVACASGWADLWL